MNTGNFEKDYQDIITELKKLRAVGPSDEFVNRFTKILMPQLGVAATRPFWPLFSFRLATIALLLVMLTTTGVVFAADRSHPGEFLYPVKKAAASIRIKLTQNPAKKIQLRLDNADQRIEELENALDKGHTKEIPNITSSYEQEVKKATKEIKQIEGNKEEVVRKVDQSLENQTQKLQAIQKTVPPTLAPAIEKAIETSKIRREKIKEPSSQLENRKPNLPALNSQ